MLTLTLLVAIPFKTDKSIIKFAKLEIKPMAARS